MTVVNFALDDSRDITVATALGSSEFPTENARAPLSLMLTGQVVDTPVLQAQNLVTNASLAPLPVDILTAPFTVTRTLDPPGFDPPTVETKVVNYHVLGSVSFLGATPPTTLPLNPATLDSFSSYELGTITLDGVVQTLVSGAVVGEAPIHGSFAHHLTVNCTDAPAPACEFVLNTNPRLVVTGGSEFPALFAAGNGVATFQVDGNSARPLVVLQIPEPPAIMLMILAVIFLKRLRRKGTQ